MVFSGYMPSSRIARYINGMHINIMVWHLEKWCRAGKEMQIENGLVDAAGEGVSESCSVVSDSLPPHGLQPTRLLCP